MTTAVDDVDTRFLKGDISAIIELRELLFGQIISILADPQETSIKAKFCDQRN